MFVEHLLSLPCKAWLCHRYQRGYAPPRPNVEAHACSQVSHAGNAGGDELPGAAVAGEKQSSAKRISVPCFMVAGCMASLDHDL